MNDELYVGKYRNGWISNSVVIFTIALTFVLAIVAIPLEIIGGYEMDVIRDILDNQLVDSNQRKMGKVDGIVMEFPDREPPRLAYIEVGVTTLTRRLNPRLAGFVATIASKWGAKQSEPFRIPWSKVRDIGIDVEAEAIPALGYEKWLRDRIIARIPGGG
ncbi:MAG: hypothetical protein V7K46_25830 [Nostoc sp.]